MKKKIIILTLISIIIFSFTACSSPQKETQLTPDIKKIQDIAELATIESYYQNVSKLEKEAGTGIQHWFEKDRKMWIEYTGVATLGINVNQVKVEIDKQKIKVTMPKAEILNLKVDESSLNENSYVSSPDGINKNPITAEDQILMIEEAQNKMRETILNDESLLNTAEERAKELIENYIKQIAELSQQEYEIEWKIIENNDDA